jgi:hypothetical protein
MATQQSQDKNKQSSNQRKQGDQSSGHQQEKQKFGNQNPIAAKGATEQNRMQNQNQPDRHDQKTGTGIGQNSKKQNMRGVDMSSGSEFSDDLGDSDQDADVDSDKAASDNGGATRKASFNSNSSMDDDGNIDRAEVKKRTGMDQTKGTNDPSTGKTSKQKGSTQEKAPRPGNEPH